MSGSVMAYTRLDLGPTLPLLASGKVRDLYEVDARTLLFVASDRISAYDVIMQNGVPGKGRVLTLMTVFWFSHLSKAIPGLKTHLVSTELPANVPESTRRQLQGRSMLVKRLKVFPIEAIVRGYITGSAWSSYQKSGTVNGVRLPEGLQESQQLPQPIYTPSTKAELGQHDENISVEQAADIVGPQYAKQIEDLALQIYSVAQEFARQRGLIIADTKFEFGLDEENDEIVLIDEVLTPDSSRFWSAADYQLGQSQNSFDKQYLRDWLTDNKLRGQEGITMTPEVVTQTSQRYTEAFQMLTGRSIEQVSQT